MKTFKIEVSEWLYNQCKIAGNGSAEKYIEKFLENISQPLGIEVKNNSSEAMKNVDIFKEGKSLVPDRTIEQIREELKSGNKYFYSKLCIECVDAPTEKDQISACGSLIRIGERVVYPMLSVVQSIKTIRNVSLCDDTDKNRDSKFYIAPIIDAKNRVIVEEIKPQTTMRYFFLNSFDIKIKEIFI